MGLRNDEAISQKWNQKGEKRCRLILGAMARVRGVAGVLATRCKRSGNAGSTRGRKCAGDCRPDCEEGVEVGDGVTNEEKSNWRPEDEPTLRGVNRGVVESPSASVRGGDGGRNQGAQGGQVLSMC
jgi:hypothetical protein